MAHRTPSGSFALCESDKCFICAKAKRQRQKRPAVTEITPTLC
ncbi:hypothetical protein [Lysinibacillus sp. G4S2]|nr:hypothetical protein [Lysinibacillus sp. G4S2]MDM5246730.1 hypothetical protein [Lysinibacillus sp. G4S2]